MPPLSDLMSKRDGGEPLVMVTAYDWPSACVAEAAEVDLVLAGDTAAMTVLGYPTTVPVTLDEMLSLTRAVRRGLRTPLLVGDLPFGSYEVSDEQAVAVAQRFIKEGGCDVVKLERGEASASRAHAIVRAGIPVMGHIGLTPQTATALGGYRTQGKSAAEALAVARDALALQKAGCFAAVIEAVPSAVVEALAPMVDLVTIGIGAGPATDGQVLVYNDLLGIYDGHVGRFVKRYANVKNDMVVGLSSFAREVRSRDFPGPEHCYEIDPEELQSFRRDLRSLVPATPAS